MDHYMAYGLLLALVNGAICISIPALISYTKRKSHSQATPDDVAATINLKELLSQEAN
ncbi:MAG: hypothetical protein P5702_15280 [Limnospira sp. PMC 1291.21]|uniref:Uncharacterized protein n=2 Tax=Limnospira TaxID=2596745 RepID=B5W7N1_LIMMA|nr:MULTISPECIES: hypothetical protein [Limnospira]MBD2670427.1 hypothetical protein [Arthrospira platensis FACHB-439]MDC0839933.1 hypothetical protein [Limnoraphis robusta]QJB26368.1 hypothetical protein HFV01_11845 [Limnospira fusiformis SAG 85.79]EDZ92473.1 hypothetical protein AmaxDRAFT_4781 [Limnospira maxima CS-328]MDT9178858.1 hypothetical protein [Limnospira sp. PMC 1238.20]